MATVTKPKLIGKIVLVNGKYQYQKPNLLDNLKIYFQTNSKEQIESDWKKSENLDQIEPTIDQFIYNTKINSKMDNEKVNHYSKIYNKSTQQIIFLYNLIGGNEFDFIELMDKMKEKHISYIPENYDELCSILS